LKFGLGRERSITKEAFQDLYIAGCGNLNLSQIFDAEAASAWLLDFGLNCDSLNATHITCLLSLLAVMGILDKVLGFVFLSVLIIVVDD